MATKESDSNMNYDKVEILSNLVDNLNLNKDKNYHERDHYEVPDWLISYECPFLWHSQETRGLGPEINITRCLEKLNDLKIDNPDFCVQRFITMLKLVVEYYVTDQMLECWANMDEAEEMLEKADREADTSNDVHPYDKIKNVLDHVVLATKAHLMALSGQIKEAKELLTTLVAAKAFNVAELACLYAIKARYFLYSGYDNGENIAVEFGKQAVELEPDNPEWSYILSKVLRQKRKAYLYTVEIPREELTLLEKAVKDSGDVKYKVYLAQVYRECAASAIRAYRNKPDFFQSEMYKTIEQFQITALDLYKKALESNPDSPAVLRRVGYGIMNLPRKMMSRTDFELSLKCLLHSLELSENQMTLHVLGTYYFRHGNDKEKALEYFEKSVQLYRSHAGLCDKVRLKFLLNPNYDPVPDLNDGLEWELKKSNRIQLIAQLATYYLFIKRDLIKSIETLNQAVDDRENHPHLKDFKSLFLRMYNPINLFHYLGNECLLFLKTDSSELTDEERSKHETHHKLVKGFFHKIIELDRESATTDVNPQLIEELLKTSKEITDKENNKKSYNQSQGYSRGGSRNFSYGRGGDRGNRRGRFYDSRNQDGERRDWRANRQTDADGSSDRDNTTGGDRQQNRGNNYNRGNRYQRQRGQYSGQYRRGDRQNTEGESGQEGSRDKEDNSMPNNRYYQQRDQRTRPTEGNSSHTNWRQK